MTAQFRKNALVNGQYYHVISRSIAQFKIFNETEDYLRITEIMDLYRYREFTNKYSNFKRLSLENQKLTIERIRKTNLMFTTLIAFCIMPTHIHLLLKQNSNNGISKYIAKVLNSYSRYFNVKYHRRGPLWEGRFKSVLVENDEQLLHLTRYIHLNPTSAGLVKKPEDWIFSSYGEYINSSSVQNLCNYKGLIDLSPKRYKKFVDSQISYQKELSKIKHLLIENYTG